MGLFKRMKDPVQGTAQVTDLVGGQPRSGTSSLWTNGEMRLIVTAEGIPPTPVTWRGQVKCSRCPVEGDSIPITVDRADPQKLSIVWSEMPKLKDRLRKRADERQQEALEEIRGDAHPEPAGVQPDPIDRLEKLDELRKSGALTEVEFELQKRRILGEQ